MAASASIWLLISLFCTASAQDPGEFIEASGPMTCSCGSSSCGNDEKWDGSGWTWQCYPKDSVRRLSLSKKMNMEELAALVNAIEAEQVNFPGMTYQARQIHFGYYLKTTPFSRVAPILAWFSAYLFPFYHHQLLFPLKLNGTVQNPMHRALGLSHLEQGPSHLVIHLVRSGAEGRLISLPPEGYNFEHVGEIKPSWILGSLNGMGETQFSTWSWNCQHFAVRLFEDVAGACTADGLVKCPPQDVKDFFPMEISPVWCLRFQALGMMGLLLGAAFMVGLSYKRLKLLKHCGAKQINSAEMLEKIHADMVTS